LAVDVVIEFIYVDLFVDLLIVLVADHPESSPTNAQKSLSSSGTLRSFIERVPECEGIVVLKSIGVLLLESVGERVGLFGQLVELVRSDTRR